MPLSRCSMLGLRLRAAPGARPRVAHSRPALCSARAASARAASPAAYRPRDFRQRRFLTCNLSCSACLEESTLAGSTARSRRLLLDSRWRCIAVISKRRRRGLCARGAWRCRDDGRRRRRRCGHAPRGLVGRRHGDHGRRGDRRGRRVTGPIGAQRHWRRGRPARGVCPWIGLCPRSDLRHGRCFCLPGVGARATNGVRAGPLATGCSADACGNGSASGVTAGSAAATCGGTTKTCRSGTSIRRSCQGKLKAGNQSPWPLKVRLNSHAWISNESSSAGGSRLCSEIMRRFSHARTMPREFSDDADQVTVNVSRAD
jgi:hypothetical protein